MISSQLLREDDAAAYLELSPATLNRWRSNGKGPSFIALETAIRYSISDLDAFIANRKVAR